MTAHSQETAEAADVRSFDNTDDAAAALDALFAEEGDDEEETDPEADADEADDDGEEQDDEQDDEPDTPAIEPPASLTADEKARFAQLPPEAQRMLSEVETRRNQQVQQATTNAANAQREAQAAAANAQMEAARTYADQYRQFVTSYAPAEPDPNLAYTNPQLYIQHKAQYDAEMAQHSKIVQQIDAMKAQADQHFSIQQQEWSRQQAAELMKVPEFADPTKRGPFLETLSNIGMELGFTPEAMADASASEILALKRAAEWKADSEKLKALQGRKMQRVRDAKSTKPNTAQPVGAGKARLRNDTMQRVRQSGDVNDAAAAILALG